MAAPMAASQPASSIDWALDHIVTYSKIPAFFLHVVGFEVLTAAVVKSTIFWD
jgi:hypothetical protein